MSQGEELYARGNDTASRPNFGQVVRGYDKRQVDHYVSQVDGEMWRLANEREQARRQIQDLGAQLERLHAELTELRQRPPKIDRATVRDVGPMVDQILTMADKQAKALKDDATEWAGRRRSEAEKVLADARERADKLQADTRAAYERAEEEARQASEQSAQQLEQARAEAHRLLEEARAQAHQEVEAAREQTQQEVQARQQALSELHAVVEAAQQELAQARQEKTAAEREVGQLQQRYGEVREDLVAELNRLEEAKQASETAEQHAKQVRARVQREAARVAQLAAAAVMAAAERGVEPTGEYPLVVPVKARAGATEGGAPGPAAGDAATGPATAAAGAHAWHDGDQSWHDGDRARADGDLARGDGGRAWGDGDRAWHGGGRAWHDDDHAQAGGQDGSDEYPLARRVPAAVDDGGTTESPAGDDQHAPVTAAGGTHAWDDDDHTAQAQAEPELREYPAAGPSQPGPNGLRDGTAELPGLVMPPPGTPGYTWFAPDGAPSAPPEPGTGEYPLDVPAQADAVDTTDGAPAMTAADTADTGTMEAVTDDAADGAGPDALTPAGGHHGWHEPDGTVPAQRRSADDTAVDSERP